MRGLASSLRRRCFGDGRELQLGRADLRGGAESDPASARALEPRTLEQLSREIAHVADYVTRLRRDIGAVRAADVAGRSLPETRSDLTRVRESTKAAADRIMAAAEALLEREASTPGYPAFVAERVTEIMEACSFEDLAGQRIERAVETLATIERRLERFAKAVKVSEAAEFYDREAIIKEARRNVLIIAGPQNGDEGVEQSTIDKLFG